VTGALIAWLLKVGLYCHNMLVAPLAGLQPAACWRICRVTPQLLQDYFFRHCRVGFDFCVGLHCRSLHLYSKSIIHPMLHAPAAFLGNFGMAVCS
jgi:hypothetical protein